MFGYVRPLKGELKVREYDSYKAVYCGLCHTLRRRGGFAARMIVNFDFTFLAMLLSQSAQPAYEYCRCVSSPIRKKCCVCNDSALEVSADYSIILYYWKLKDSAQDEGFLKATAAKIAALFLKRAYNKASTNAPDFNSLVREKLAQLQELERSCCRSIDETADKFAQILAAAACGVEDESRRRELELLLYHMGRAIYILDAANDLAADVKNGSYNPLIHRFSLDADKLSDDEQRQLSTTLCHSINLMSSAFELLSAGYYTPIIENIIYLGVPWVQQMVFTGRWRKQRKSEKKI